MPIKIAINGFGRIGRAAFKIAITNKKYQVVAINDLTDIKTLAHLLKYDSVYGIAPFKISSDAKNLIVNGKKYPISAEPDPTKLPWKRYKVDVVLECTGRFVKGEDAKKHLRAGAKKVILSAPAKSSNEIKTFVLGVNADKYKGQDVISNASCTTNCIAPVTQVMQDNFGVAAAMMTTIHAYTADQNLVDGPHKDLRRARASGINVIPTTTGAAIATTEVIPEIKGKFDGLSVRVPVACGSLSDITFVLNKKVTVEQVNKALIKASKSVRYQGILLVTSDPVVSSDIVGNPYSSIVDLSLTKVVDGALVKVVAWYDNEWGYANRLVEMVNVVK